MHYPRRTMKNFAVIRVLLGVLLMASVCRTVLADEVAFVDFVDSEITGTWNGVLSTTEVLLTDGSEWQVEASDYILSNPHGYETCYKITGSYSGDLSPSEYLIGNPAGSIDGVKAVTFKYRVSTSGTHTGVIYVDVGDGSGANFQEAATVPFSNNLLEEVVYLDLSIPSVDATVRLRSETLTGAGQPYIYYVRIEDHTPPDDANELVDMRWIRSQSSIGSYPDGSFSITDVPQGNSWTATGLGANSWLPQYEGHNAIWLRNDGAELECDPAGLGDGIGLVEFQLAAGSLATGSGLHRLQYSVDGGPWLTGLTVPVDAGVNVSSLSFSAAISNFNPRPAFQWYSVDLNRAGDVRLRFTYEVWSGNYPGNAIDNIRIHPLTPVPSLGQARIVCFGDSTTAPRYDGSLPVYCDLLDLALSEYQLHAELANSGKGGSHSGTKQQNSVPFNIDHALDRLDYAVLNLAPAVVVMQYGINDSWINDGVPTGESRIPLELYIQNILELTRTTRAWGIDVILMTPNQLGASVAGFQYDRLAAYAQVLRTIALKKEVPLLDVWQLYEDYAAVPGQDVDDLLLDGVHPNSAGHALLAGHLRPMIVAELMTPAEPTQPPDGSTNVSLNADLLWVPGGLAAEHDLYFGTSPTPPPADTGLGDQYDPGPLLPDTTYYWRIDGVNLDVVLEGELWSFTTAPR